MSSWRFSQIFRRAAYPELGTFLKPSNKQLAVMEGMYCCCTKSIFVNLLNHIKYSEKPPLKSIKHQILFLDKNYEILVFRLLFKGVEQSCVLVFMEIAVWKAGKERRQNGKEFSQGAVQVVKFEVSVITQVFEILEARKGGYILEIKEKFQ